MDMVQLFVVSWHTARKLRRFLIMQCTTAKAINKDTHIYIYTDTYIYVYID